MTKHSALVSAQTTTRPGRAGRATDLVSANRGGRLEVAAEALAVVRSTTQQTAGTFASAAMSVTCEPELWIMYWGCGWISCREVQHRRLVPGRGQRDHNP